MTNHVRVKNKSAAEDFVNICHKTKPKITESCSSRVLFLCSRGGSGGLKRDESRSATNFISGFPDRHRGGEGGEGLNFFISGIGYRKI